MVDFITTEFFVSLFVSVLAFSSIAYTCSSADDLAPATGILLISYGMFTYTILPVLGLGAEGMHWFLVPPPTSVSKVTLFALFCVCASVLWRRYPYVRSVVTGRKIWPMVALVLAPLLTTMFGQIALQQEFTTHGILQIKFAFIFSSFCLVAVSVGTFHRPQRSAKGFCIVTGALLSIATIIAFIEVAYGLAPVANFVHGDVELRASSIFLNPNWFAVAVAPCVFIACKVSQVGKPYASAGLFCLCTVALLLSGSRSTIVLIAVAMLALALALHRCGASASFARREIARSAVLGVVAGLLTGFLAAVAVGGQAAAYYTKLLERVFGWPIYFLSGDPQTWMSVSGRVSSTPGGASVVDNAYVYWLEENTLAGVWVIILMACVIVLTVRQFMRTHSFDDALRLAVAVFVVCAGMAGQVYWAFPVWPILAVMFGYVLHPVVSEWFGRADRAPAAELCGRLMK